jgi:Cu/Ag efflux pump CusA
MVPLGSVASLQETTGPDRYVRSNLYPAAEAQGAAAPGYSTGQALDAMERLAAEVPPPGITLEWTELAYQGKAAAGASGQVFILAIVFVFLVLVAQYENWSLPMAVILTVPLCLVGAIWFIHARGLDNPGRRSTCSVVRRRRGNAPLAGLGGLRRHVKRHAFRNCLHPRPLRSDSSIDCWKASAGQG